MKLREQTHRYRESLCTQYLQRARGVLHLGAHVGQEAEKYAQLGKPVLWIEAMPDIHAQLVSNLKKYANQRSLCALIGDVAGGKRTFHVSSNSNGASSSLFQFGPYANGRESLWPALGLRMVRDITLQMITLDQLLQDNAVDPANHDYWVVDLQGAEILALRGATSALQPCLALNVEVSKVPVYENGPLWPDLREFLERAGFMPLWEPELDHDDVLFVRGDQKWKVKDQFQSSHYLKHNQARLDHLASLELDLQGKSVLEVGAGIGDHTEFYLKHGCTVTVTDVRPENISSLFDRFSGRTDVTVRQLDMDNPVDLDRRFDVVHCYGLLYHLERPAEALSFLERHCSSVLLLETCVTPGDDLRIHPLPEPTHQFSQAFYGKGCRPTRAWVWAHLKALIPYVYSTRTQPAHEEFPLDWVAETQHKSSALKRAVFVASRTDLGSNKNLLDMLPSRQVRLHEQKIA